MDKWAKSRRGLLSGCALGAGQAARTGDRVSRGPTWTRESQGAEGLRPGPLHRRAAAAPWSSELKRTLGVLGRRISSPAGPPPSVRRRPSSRRAVFCPGVAATLWLAWGWEGTQPSTTASPCAAAGDFARQAASASWVCVGAPKHVPTPRCRDYHCLVGCRDGPFKNQQPLKCRGLASNPDRPGAHVRDNEQSGTRYHHHHIRPPQFHTTMALSTTSLV